MSKEKLFDWKYFLIVLLLVLCCSNTLIVQVYFPPIFAFAGLLTFSFISIFVNAKTKVEKNKIQIVAILVAIPLISMILNFDLKNFNGVLLTIIKITAGFLTVYSLESQKLWRHYKYVIVLICLWSIVFNYVIAASPLINFFPVITNSYGIKFYNSILAVKIISYGFFGARNYGIFSEPAVFCFYILLGLAFEFGSDENSKEKLISVFLMIIASITTFSPVGFIIAITACIMTLIEVKKKKESKYISILLCVLVAIIICLMFKSEVFNTGYESMISKSTLTEGNGKGRMNAIVSNLSIWLNRPIFGNSLEGSTTVALLVGANTTTTCTMLSCFGLLFTTLVTKLQYDSVKNLTIGKSIIQRCIIFVLFLVTINNHGLLQSDWYWIFTLSIFGGNNESSNSNS